MATDLGLDPSDPLNLLLHNSSQNNDNSMDESNTDDSSPPDWSQLSSLWDGSESVAAGLKPYPDLMDFSELNSLPMDMDFNPAIGMDPGALHYDPLKFNPAMPFSYEEAAAFHNISAEMIPPQFTFTFQGAINASSSSSFSSASSSSLSSPESSVKERRLSVTSSSSSSGASFSPVMENLASPSTSYSSDASPSPAVPKLEVNAENFKLDGAAEIAESVRQSAGVMLAVPMSANLSSQVLAQSMMAAGNAPNKVPIPRLPRATGSRSPISSSSSAASTPPPSTPPMNNSLPGKLIINTKPLSSGSSSSALPTPTTAAPQAGARPKTSHTTIERRYRTNLNARIQSLRMAVPALRVLEDRDGGNGKKIKKNLKDGVYLKGAGIGIDTEDGSTVDVIDERGFVDGVKVARKCSKANVLGKAVEYIRVLKKREMRLKAEQNGMKALICGLVGGPALLKEWEIRWRERFGGEEKDEVEGDDAEDEDSDDEEGDDDEEVGKKRKRAKTSVAPAKKPMDRKPAPSPIVTTPVTQLSGCIVNGAPVPEKRKRGRPRKVVPPPAPVITSAPHISHQQAAAAAQQQQMDQMMHSPDHQQVQAPQYLLAVFALFSFFNSPLASQFAGKATHQHTGLVLTPPLALSPEIVLQYSELPVIEAPQLIQVSWAWKDYFQYLHLAASGLVLGVFLWNWVAFAFRKKHTEPNSSPSPAVASRDDKTNWSSVCDEVVLKGDTHSMSAVSLTRMYHALSSPRSANVSRLTSLSLAIYNTRGPFSYVANLKAHSLWRQARTESQLVQTQRSTKPAVRIVEKLVLDSFTLEEAAKAIASSSPKEKANGEVALSPVDLLGAILVKQRVKVHLGQLFVEAVSISQDDLVQREQEKDLTKQREQDMRHTIEAARELGGDIEELGRLLERVWKSSVLDDFNPETTAEDAPEEGIDAEIQSLLTALVLYRRMFSGSNTPKASSLLISPPPSPTSRTSQESNGPLLALRKALGNWVFEDGDREGSMEEARDKVVDLIVDMERRGRSATPLA